MSATFVREKRQTTLPSDVCEPAGIEPGDQIDWRFEAGEIRGRKMVPLAPRRVTARLVTRGGKLFFEVPDATIGEDFSEAVARAVCEERENR